MSQKYILVAESDGSGVLEKELRLAIPAEISNEELSRIMEERFNAVPDKRFHERKLRHFHGVHRQAFMLVEVPIERTGKKE